MDALDSRLAKRTTELGPRRRWLKVWWLLWLAIALCLLVPMRYTALKVGLVAVSAGLWGTTLYLFWGRRSVRIVCACIALAAAGLLVFLILPGHAVDTHALRREYVESLLAYNGTPYVWGGGNRLGIDCSGLVQAGLIKACMARAVTTCNPQLAREGLTLWWHNRSARALGEGYRDETRLLFEAPSLNTANYDLIEPGDLAVLSDGVHVLAYIGGHDWIEADPIPMRVIVAHSPRSTDIYFNSRVRVMRWRVLD